MTLSIVMAAFLTVCALSLMFIGIGAAISFGRDTSASPGILLFGGMVSACAIGLALGAGLLL